MPRPIKPRDEEVSRDEARLILMWLVDEKRKPLPRGGVFSLLHRKPAEIAAEYNVTEDEIIVASKRKVADSA